MRGRRLSSGVFVTRSVQGFPPVIFKFPEAPRNKHVWKAEGFSFSAATREKPSVKLNFLENNQNANLEIWFVTFSVLLPFTFPTATSSVRTGKYFVHKHRKPVINCFFSLIYVNVFHSFSFLP